MQRSALLIVLTALLSVNAKLRAGNATDAVVVNTAGNATATPRSEESTRSRAPRPRSTPFTPLLANTGAITLGMPSASGSALRFRAVDDQIPTDAVPTTEANKGMAGEWEEFKRRNNKTYLNRDQIKRMARMGRMHGAALDQNSDENRMNLYFGRKLAIDDFNRQAKSYRRGLNQFADMTLQEVIAKHTGLLLAGRKPKGAILDMRSFARIALPRKFDWRERGALTEVRNQGPCGCCWAFAATATLESKMFIKARRLVALSEQNLLDCDTINEQCNGGTPWEAYDWVQSNGGQEENENYPYEVFPEKCRQDKTRMLNMTVKGYMQVKPSTEEVLMTALFNEGPVAVAVNAGLTTFIDYREGIYSDPECSNQDDDLKHAMVLVGYGEEADGAYWILRNSWGKNWGENGYIRILRKDNLCGIMTYAVVPVLE